MRSPLTWEDFLNTGWRPPWQIELSFGYSPSQMYDRAVREAKSYGSYQIVYAGDDEKSARHVVRFNEPQNDFWAFWWLCEIVENWKSSTITIYGTQVDSRIIYRFYSCYEKRFLRNRRDDESFQDQKYCKTGYGEFWGCDCVWLSSAWNWVGRGTFYTPSVGKIFFKIDLDWVYKSLLKNIKIYQYCPLFPLETVVERIRIISIPSDIDLEDVAARMLWKQRLGLDLDFLLNATHMLSGQASRLSYKEPD